MKLLGNENTNAHILLTCLWCNICIFEYKHKLGLSPIVCPLKANT